MKQVVQNYRSGALSLKDVPPPQLRPDGVLVRTAFSLISAGTERGMIDLAQKNLLEKARARPDLVRKVLDKARTEGVLTAYQKAMQRLDTDMPLGYSSAGMVVAVGERVDGLTEGMPVACAGGGVASHAELVFVPRNLCVPVPAGVDLRQAAYATLGAIAMQGVRTAAPSLGDIVAVIGLGLVGLLTAQLLKVAGCRVVGLEPNEDRARLATELGADVVVRAADELAPAVASLSDGFGADAVLIAASSSSSEQLELAGEVARDRARIVVVGQVGMTVPRKLYYEKELSLLMSRSYGPGRYDRVYEEQGIDYPIGYVRWTESRNLRAFLDLVARGQVSVDRLITHEFAIDDALQAYGIIQGTPPEPHIGVLLRYPTSEPLPTATVWLNGYERSVQPPRPAAVSTHGRSEVVVGVIGAGSFATATLLPALGHIEAVRLRAICSRTGLSARATADRLGFDYCTSDVRDVLDDPGINAVLIATRPDSHADLAIAALTAGKHVFVEKPLAVDRTQLGAIADAAQSAQRASSDPSILMVGFNRRFAAQAVEVKEFLRNSGRPLLATYRINANYLPATDWQHDPEQGGGRLIGEAGHFIDLLTFLLNSAPAEVYARSVGTADPHLTAQENAALTIHFADGSVGVITYTTGGSERFGKERLEVFGGGSTALIDDFRRLELLRGGRRRVRRDLLGQEKGHRAELAAFVEAIRLGRPAPVPLNDYLLTTLCTFQAVESLRSGRPEPVRLEDQWAVDGEASNEAACPAPAGRP